jgi:FkbM family methyltransferase
MDPNDLKNWRVLDNDNALAKAIEKQNKWSRRSNSRVLDYQKNQLDIAIQMVKNFDLAIDAGANYGIMSWHLDRRFQRVLSFEIDHLVRECLKANMQNFSCDRVEIHDCGLGDCEKMTALNYIKNSFATSIDPSIMLGEFPIRPLDSFNLSACGFIKIDCEGYEPHIIKGAEATIKKYHPVILMEDKGLSQNYGLDPDAAEKLLASWGYQRSTSFKKDCIMTYQG